MPTCQVHSHLGAAEFIETKAPGLRLILDNLLDAGITNAALPPRIGRVGIVHTGIGLSTSDVHAIANSLVAAYRSDIIDMGIWLVYDGTLGSFEEVKQILRDRGYCRVAAPVLVVSGDF